MLLSRAMKEWQCPQLCPLASTQPFCGVTLTSVISAWAHSSYYASQDQGLVLFSRTQFKWIPSGGKKPKELAMNFRPWNPGNVSSQNYSALLTYQSQVESTNWTGKVIRSLKVRKSDPSFRLLTCHRINWISAQTFYSKIIILKKKKIKFSALIKFFVVLMISILTAAIICVLMLWFNSVKEGGEGRTKGKKQNCGGKNNWSDSLLIFNLCH